MSGAATGRPTRRPRGPSPRAAALTGGALMLAGQAIFAVVRLSDSALPSPDASSLVLGLAALVGVVLLWAGPIAVSVAAGQPWWVGAIAFPGAGAVFILGILAMGSMADGALLNAMEVALSVACFAGALAVVGGGRVSHRLAAVAVVVVLTGTLGLLVNGAPYVAHVGLVAAFGVIAWIAPRTCMVSPSRAS